MSKSIIFWESFRRNASTWALLMRAGKEQAVFEMVDTLLDQSKISFCFDITHDELSCYFILSPEGDFGIASEIDEFTLLAPQIPDWIIYNRRQRKSIQDACAIVHHLYLIDPHIARFCLSLRNDAQFIQMYVPPDTDLEPEEQQGLINTFLWHALGEDLVMKKRIYGEVVLAEPPLETITAIELVNLFHL